MSVRNRGTSKSPHWHVDFRVRGVRYRIAVPEARTKHEAQQAESHFRSEVFEGRFGNLKPHAPTFKEFVETVYLPYARANKRSHARDAAYCRQFADAFGERRLHEITPLDIERYKQQLIKTPIKDERIRKASTVNMHLCMIGRVLGYAVEAGVLISNPVRKVRKLRAPQHRTRYMTDDEETQLFAALSHPLRSHVLPLVRLALLTGMRRGELLRMRWDTHVNFERGEVYATNTKTGRDRDIPMSDQCRRLLIEMRAAAIGDFLFMHNGKPLGKPSKAFKAACAEAGITNLCFHDLRHTFATRLGDAGASMADIAALLGHSQISMSARYTHATEQGKRRAVAALDARCGQVLVTTAFPARTGT